MQMIHVNSSAIQSAGYDPDTQQMKVKFNQGQTYNFCRVPEHIFKGLISAASKGTYYNSHIRGRYQC